VKSLQYSFVIAIVYPLAPLAFSTIADRIERKWQIAAAALGVAVFGLIFSQQTSAAMLILCGALITASNNLLSYAYHAYQAELFPTRVRARAVGFVYSFSRLSTVAASFAIALLLKSFGTIGVFAFIACSMSIVAFAIGVFGPRTRGVSLEELSR
jgi:putative MFS transporter